MLKVIEDVNLFISNLVWGWPAIILFAIRAAGGGVVGFGIKAAIELGMKLGAHCICKFNKYYL